MELKSSQHSYLELSNSTNIPFQYDYAVTHKDSDYDVGRQRTYDHLKKKGRDDHSSDVNAPQYDHVTGYVQRRDTESERRARDLGATSMSNSEVLSNEKTEFQRSKPIAARRPQLRRVPIDETESDYSRSMPGDDVTNRPRDDNLQRRHCRRSSSDFGSENKAHWSNMALDAKLMDNWRTMFGKMRTRMSTRGYSNNLSTMRPAVRDADIPKATPNKKSSRLLKMLLVGVVILLVLVIVIPILVLVAFKADDSKEETLWRFSLTTTLSNFDYTTGMANDTSSEFWKVAGPFCEQMDNSFSGSDLHDNYRGCAVDSLARGSVVVVYSLFLKTEENVSPARERLISAITRETNLTAIVNLGVLQFLRVDIRVLQETAITADEITVHAKAAFGSSCTTEGVITGCTTTHALCSGGICACPLDKYHTPATDICNPIDCGDPPPISHGTVHGPAENTYLATFRISCDNGYELDDGAVNVNVTCQTQNTWGTIPSCNPVECPKYDLPPHTETANASLTGNIFNDEITVTCISGYTSSKETLNHVTCLANKTWSHSPSCEIVNCQKYTGPINSNYQESTNTTYGAEILVTCDEGYNITGSLTVTCGDDGEWSKGPTCSLIDCGTYSGFLNSHFNIPDDTTFGTKINVSCDTGYKLTGANVVTCDKNGNWFINSTCDIVDCGTPVAAANVKLINATATTYNSRAEIQCDTGYSVDGSDKIVCQSDGNWSEPPMCSIVQCEEPESPGNGTITETTGNSFGDTSKLECNIGFSLIGNSTISCQATGKWSGLPLCSDECGVLAAPDNSQIEAVPDSKNVAMKCISGYELTGENIIKCDDDGNWEVKGSCELVKCPLYAAPKYGNVSEQINGNVFEDELTVSCKTGYVVAGENTTEKIITCLSDGNWSASPSCQIVDCGPYKVDKNGYFDNYITTYGSEIIVTCQTGYTLEGEPNVICGVNGEWSEGPVCNIVDCGPLSAPDNSVLANEDTTTYESTINVTCNVGYNITGESVVTCDENGAWSASPVCKIVDCYEFNLTPDFGFTVPGNKTTFGSTITINCASGFEVVGDETLSCTETGVWEDPPTCEILDCGDPTDVANGYFVEYNSTTVGYNVFVECDNGFDLVGESEMNCTYSGDWSEPPTCDKVSCDEYTPPKNGKIVSTNGTTHGSVITVECDTGYYLADGDVSMVTCEHDGTWKGPLGEEPVCTSIGSVSFTSSCYAFRNKSVGNLTCEVSQASDWKLIVLLNAQTQTVDQPQPLAIVNKSADGTVARSTSTDHVTVTDKSVFPDNNATIVVQFDPVEAGDEGNYICAASKLYDLAATDQSSSNSDRSKIFIRSRPRIVLPETIALNATITIQCFGETGFTETDGTRDANIELQVKYQDDDEFAVIPPSVDSTTTVVDTECPVKLSLNTTVIADKSWDNAAVRCSLKTLANDEMLSEDAAISLT